MSSHYSSKNTRTSRIRVIDPLMSSGIIIDDLAAKVDELSLKAARPPPPSLVTMGWMRAINPSPATFASRGFLKRGNRYTPYSDRQRRGDPARYEDDIPSLTDDSSGSSSRGSSPFSDDEYMSREITFDTLKDDVYETADHMTALSLDLESLTQWRDVSPPVESKLRAATFDAPTYADINEMESDDDCLFY
ncbi:hypothetical protein HWV62_38813 [Athelia sp. TMB]|nr:hypothetical protein HWV62_38813 [Athelia sp. TMB]